MDIKFLGNIISSLSPGQDFCIYGEVDNENDYNQNVVFTQDVSSKPTWAAVQAGQNPEQWVIVRGKRKGRLKSCDWTVLPDVPMATGKKEEWETYRQALRDITDQPDPFNITWPTPPA